MKYFATFYKLPHKKMFSYSDLIFVHLFQVNCKVVLLSFIHFFTHSSHMRLTECKEFEHMNISFHKFDPTVPTYSTMSKVGLKLICYQGSGFLRLLIDLKKCGQSYKFPNSHKRIDQMGSSRIVHCTDYTGHHGWTP